MVRDAFVERYLPDIRGFRMTAPHVEPVFKLSQDKNQVSFDGVVEGLRARPDEALAAEMVNLKRHLDEAH